jgi:hypothetical protein
MKIEVTREDIRHGEPLDPRCCPIAIAVRRLTAADRVSVNGATVKVWKAGDYRCERLPERALRFMDRFDEGTRVRVFTFDLPDLRE